MKEDKYTKSLANNQVCAIFHLRDIGKNVLVKFIKQMCGDAHVGVPIRNTTSRLKPTETSVFEFFY